MFSYVACICRESRRELEDKIQGIYRLQALLLLLSIVHEILTFFPVNFCADASSSS